MSWASDIFKAKAAKSGGLVRRKLASIDRYSSRAAVKAEAKKRGFAVVENGDQWVFLCNAGSVRIICK